MKKILVSPGYGAGWSSWNEHGKWAAEYQPIIDFLEGGGAFVEKSWNAKNVGQDAYKGFEEPGASVLKRFLEDFHAETGETYFYLGGAAQLVVDTVYGPYRIEEYDGSESVETPGGQEWW